MMTSSVPDVCPAPDTELPGAGRLGYKGTMAAPHAVPPPHGNPGTVSQMKCCSSDASAEQLLRVKKGSSRMRFTSQIDVEAKCMALRIERQLADNHNPDTKLCDAEANKNVRQRSTTCCSNGTQP